MKPMKMWAWWDNEGEKFRHIYDSKKKVGICFPYGYKYEEKQGRGELVEVIVLPAEVLNDALLNLLTTECIAL